MDMENMVNVEDPAGHVYDFPLSRDYPLEDLHRVQARLLEMAIITSDILKEAGIQHCLALGSLLGAMRHKGFIPWDDDLDFWVEDERYEEALELLREKLPDDLIVHDQLTDPIYWPVWSRVRDLKTTTVFSEYDNDNHYKYKGICIDLYRMRTEDSDNLKHVWLRDRRANAKAKYDRGILTAEELEKYYAWIDDMYQTWFVEYEGKFHGKIVTDNFNWELEEYDQFFPLGEAEFEGVMFPVPKDPILLLDCYFHNTWQAPPPYEKRLTHYSKVEFL